MGKSYVVFRDHDGTKRVVSIKSVMAVIEKHGYQRIDGDNFRMSPAMVIEAQQLDAKAGVPGLSLEALQRLETAPALLIAEEGGGSSKIKFDPVEEPPAPQKRRSPKDPH